MSQIFQDQKHAYQRFWPAIIELILPYLYLVSGFNSAL